MYAISISWKQLCYSFGFGCRFGFSPIQTAMAIIDPLMCESTRFDLNVNAFESESVEEREKRSALAFLLMRLVKQNIHDIKEEANKQTNNNNNNKKLAA